MANGVNKERVLYSEIRQNEVLKPPKEEKSGSRRVLTPPVLAPGACPISHADKRRRYGESAAAVPSWREGARDTRQVPSIKYQVSVLVHRLSLAPVEHVAQRALDTISGKTKHWAPRRNQTTRQQMGSAARRGNSRHCTPIKQGQAGRKKKKKKRMNKRCRMRAPRLTRAWAG